MPLESIRKRIAQYERPTRRALSSRFPILVKPAIFARRSVRTIQNSLTLKKPEHKDESLPCVIARHSSLLYRKLGESDPALQEGKVNNLKIAIARLDGLVIPPGEVFSMWHALGSVTAKKGYVDGMLLSNGKVSQGIGGGLCQLSNFLFWILLHADVEIVERKHHSVDAFPDSGRTLPFGSGATVFYNYIDLKMCNVSDRPLQIKIWLTDTQLKGQILSDMPARTKFHLVERNHCFVRSGSRYYRYNEIMREAHREGVKVAEELIVVNCAPVIYPITEEYIRSFAQHMLCEL